MTASLMKRVSRRLTRVTTVIAGLTLKKKEAFVHLQHLWRPHLHLWRPHLHLWRPHLHLWRPHLHLWRSHLHLWRPHLHLWLNLHLRRCRLLITWRSWRLNLHLRFLRSS